MSGLYLSRARLRTGRGEPLSALAPTLLRGSKGDTVGNAHRILWMLFQNREGDEKRDFLWREESSGRYLILSRREPINPDGLFDIETKAFEPELACGGCLHFTLRANPVISRKIEGSGRQRGTRCDIVMNALHALPSRRLNDRHGESERAKARDTLAQETSKRWIQAQGEKYGFNLVPNPEENNEPFLTVTNYETIEIPRMREGRLEHRNRFARFGILDISGLIEIKNVEAFIRRLPEGFGKAKAFGCGLMLIKRAA